MSDVDLQDSYTESNRIDKIDTEAEIAAKHNEPIICQIKKYILFAKFHEGMVNKFESKIEILKKQLI